jgi:hypothetical protein
MYTNLGAHCSSAGADGYREDVDRAFNEYG